MIHLAVEIESQDPVAGHVQGERHAHRYHFRGGLSYNAGVPLLATLRARGPANSAFEASFLEHLKASSVAVAAPIRDRSGKAC